MRSRTLAQVKVGDQVTFTYFQSVAVRVLKEGESFPKGEREQIEVQCEKGEKPQGEIATEKSFNFTINAIDKEAKNVTLIDKNGKLLTVQPLRPAKLARSSWETAGGHLYGFVRGEGRAGNEEEISPGLPGCMSRGEALLPVSCLLIKHGTSPVFREVPCVKTLLQTGPRCSNSPMIRISTLRFSNRPFSVLLSPTG